MYSEKSARETLLIFYFPGGVLIADFGHSR
nr:MAG TPA: hypothetical protein [Caudoviricetes sp.]